MYNPRRFYLFRTVINAAEFTTRPRLVMKRMHPTANHKKQIRTNYLSWRFFHFEGN
jgi:hypothetical protein